MTLGVPLPPWLQGSRRVFGEHSLHNAHIEYSDTNEDVGNSLRCLDIRRGEIVIGVTGSADLMLLALRHDPAFVASFDVNPAQNALAELKRSAIATLSYPDYLALLGYRPSPSRHRLLASLLDSLPDDVRDFWMRDDMVQAIDQDLWRQGSATRKDLELWNATLRQLEARIGPHDLGIVLGLDGSPEQRAALRTRVARIDPKYAEPAIRNNNHFKFDAFRYPDGMANQVAVARYAASFLPNDRATPPLSEADYQLIRSRLHRITFQTQSILDALEEMPPDAFDRAYLSNVTEYLTLAQERKLVESLIDKGRAFAVSVLLYLALSPTQQRDLLDHSTWSERGIARFLNASQWKTRFEREARPETWADSLARGGAKQAISRARNRLLSLNEEDLSNQAKRTARRVRDFDYLRAGQRALSSTRTALQEARNRWAEVRQLSEHDYVLIENEARTAALFSDVYANLRATHASKSFYGFDHAILHKVTRRGATYAIPNRLAPKD